MPTTESGIRALIDELHAKRDSWWKGRSHDDNDGMFDIDRALTRMLWKAQGVYVGVA